MKPGSGAISFRGLISIVVSACVLLSARAALADEGATPGPRPQAIAQAPMVLLDPPPPSEEAAAQPDTDTALAGANPPASSEVSTGNRNPDESVALGVPAAPAHESQLLAPDPSAEAADSMLGPLDPRNNEITRVIGALAVVIGLMLLLRVAARRLGGPLLDGGRPSGVLLVLARYPIARGQHLVLLKLGRRVVLCHQAKGEMHSLCQIENEDEVAALLARIEAGSRGRDAARFEKMLEDFNSEHRRRTYTQRGGADMQSAMAQAPIIDLTRRRSGGGGTSGGGGAAGWLKLRRTAS